MILTIGSTDVSNYVEVGYRVDKANIVKSQWEAINGAEHQLILGCKYTINCNLGHVPASTAAAICTALDAQKVSITFANPGAVTADFIAPNVSATLITESASGTAGELWDIAFSATSEPQLYGA
jgi:hypothetical protein